jgi:glycine oxidase
MSHIIVVGGGILGMLTARELIQSNYQVTLLEQGQLARESSWAGGGILSPLYPWRYPDSVTRLASWSQQFYPELCQSLLQTTGINPEYTQNGMLVIASDEQSAALNWAKRHDRQMEIISRAVCTQLEPALAEPTPYAIWMPAVGQVRNPRLGKALAADIAQRGVCISTGHPVTGLHLSNGQVRGVLRDSAKLEADAVIICAGAWTAELLAAYLPTPMIKPIRGQMLLFKTEPGAIRRIVLEANRYVIPRRDGYTLFGSTLEESGFDKSTTPAARLELTTLAIKRFPILQHRPVVKQWAGLRPGSPAGIPYIAPHPELKGLYINAGHFRNGVVLGLASARLMADIVTGSHPIVAPEPYTLTAARDSSSLI